MTFDERQFQSHVASAPAREGIASRRQFLKQTALTAAGVAGLEWTVFASGNGKNAAPTAAAAPWYRRALRWGQTNIAEQDPLHYDIARWRVYWRRTQVQAIIVNAGGIVAY